jgi:hypothetical protein
MPHHSDTRSFTPSHRSGSRSSTVTPSKYQPPASSAQVARQSAYTGRSSAPGVKLILEYTIVRQTKRPVKPSADPRPAAPQPRQYTDDSGRSDHSRRSLSEAPRGSSVTSARPSSSQRSSRVQPVPRSNASYTSSQCRPPVFETNRDASNALLRRFNTPLTEHDSISQVSSNRHR